MQESPPWLYSPASDHASDDDVKCELADSGNLIQSPFLEEDPRTDLELEHFVMDRKLMSLENSLSTSPSFEMPEMDGNSVNIAVTPLQRASENDYSSKSSHTLPTAVTSRIPFSHWNLRGQTQCVVGHHYVLMAKEVIDVYEHQLTQLETFYREINQEYDLFVQNQLKTTITPISLYLEDVLRIPIAATLSATSVDQIAGDSINCTGNSGVRRQSTQYEPHIFDLGFLSDFVACRKASFERAKRNLQSAALERIRELIELISENEQKSLLSI